MCLIEAYRYSKERTGHDCSEDVPPPPPPIFRLTAAAATFFAAAVLAVSLLVIATDDNVAYAQSPGDVSNITVTRADGSLTASWNAGSGATSYHVTYSSDGGSSWSAAASPGDDHAATSITINGLNNNDTYIVGVRALNGDVGSGWVNSSPSGPFVPTPTPTPVSPPGDVSNITVTRADGSLTASWDAGSGATSYHITYSSNGMKSWNLGAYGHTETSITITANNGATYVVGVRALNSGGGSGWVNSSPSDPFSLDERGISVTDMDGNDISALSVPEGGEASYKVKLTAAPTEDTKVCIGLSVRDNNDPDITFKGESSDVVALNLTFTPSNWDTTQTVTLVAAEDDDYANGIRDVDHDTRNDIHYWPGKVELAVTEIDNDTPPSAPSAPSSVALTRADGTVSASWDAVSGASKYHVTYSTDGMQSWTALTTTHAGTSISITDADNDSSYVVGVRAGNDGGWSGWTNSDSAGPYTPPSPSAPTNFTVTNGDGFFDLAWDAVSDATSYDVRAKISNSNLWTSVATGVATNSYRYTTSDVVNKLAVRATNANGSSAWSELSRGPNDTWLTTVQQANASGGLVMAAAQSGASAQSAQGQSQLAAPASITVTRDNFPDDEKLHVTWTAVSGATGYNIVCSAHNGWSWWHCGSVTSGSTTTFTVDNDSRVNPPQDLVWTRSYKVAVRAVTSDPSQASPWANTNEAHPAIQPTSTWANRHKNPISYSRGTGSITLSWVPPVYAQGFEIDCDTYETPYNPSYTRCADVETATVTDGKINVAISSWTVGGTTYTIDDTETYDIRVRTTNEWGHSPFRLAPLIYPNVELTVSNIGVNGATLTIAHHSGNWYYKADKSPDNTCKGPVSGSSKDLTSSPSNTGLDAHTSYVYSAYSDSTCTTANLLATAAQFTTLSSVSNLTSTKDSTPSDITIGQRQAVAFTTGSNSGGYTLKSVTLPLRSASASGGTNGLQLKLYRMAGTGQHSSTSAPTTTALATLSGTAPTASTWTDTTWTCSGSGCSLSANRVYFVVATFDGTGKYQWAWAVTETQTADPSENGWDIEYDHYKEDAPTPREWKSWSGYNLAEIVFETVPSLASSNVSATGATLTIEGHSGDWYYKYTSPSGGTCSSSAVSGTNTTVTLTPGTSYTFAAYSDSECSNLLATAAAFTTKSKVSVSTLSAADTGTVDVGRSSNQTKSGAQGFRTGSNTGGYTLSTIDIQFRATVGSPPNLEVTLHAASGVNPNTGTTLATLSGSNPTSAGSYTYTCSSGCDLQESKTYFVMMKAPSSANGSYYKASITTGTATKQPADNGWTISDEGPGSIQPINLARRRGIVRVPDQGNGVAEVGAGRGMMRMGVSRNAHTSASPLDTRLREYDVRATTRVCRYVDSRLRGNDGGVARNDGGGGYAWLLGG